MRRFFISFTILFFIAKAVFSQPLNAEVSKSFISCLSSLDKVSYNETERKLIESICLLKKAIDESLLEEGLALADSVQSNLSQISDSNLIVEYWLNLAMLHQSSGFYVQSSEYYLKCSDYFLSREMHERALDVFISLAELNRSQRQFDLSQFYLNQAEVYASRDYEFSPKVLARLWHRFAAVAMEQRDNAPEAILFSNRSLSYSEPNLLYDEMATSYLELGYIYMNLDDERAEKYLLKAVEMREKLGLQLPYTNSVINLFRYYIRNRNFEKAEEVLKIIKGIIDQFHFKNYEQEYYDLKSDVLFERGQFQEAYKKLDTSFNLFRILSADQYTERISYISQKYQNEFTAQQLRTAELEREQALAEAKRERNIRTVLILVIVLATLAFLLLFHFFNRTKTQKEAIEIQQKLIEEQNKNLSETIHQKEALLKEVHHRVKNNLQVINSMLNIQARSEKEPQIIASIQKAQQRVKSIAMVHEKLYQSEGLSTVDFNNYISELILQIRDAFYVGGFDLHLNVKVEDIVLEIEQAIPLGLIINEIVTNSFKYAFKDRMQGTISIYMRAQNEEYYELIISDDGIGYNPNSNESGNFGIGKILIDLLIRQLKAIYSIDNQNGTSYKITLRR